MAQPTLTPLPPAEAVAALTRRGARLDPTYSWQDAWEAEHATMFTVAKSAGFDILGDIHAAMVKAIGEGTTFQDFAKTLKPVLETKGWWGRKEVTDPLTGEIQERTLGSTRRLRTIFETNMRVSYAAGHWSQFERNKVARPWLRYVSLLYGKDRRQAHIRQHNVCLPVDDPHWDTWAPPCGWGCQCTLQSLSQRDVDRMRGDLKFATPDSTTRAYVNQRTGEITRVPDGIDPGWGYNPGKAGWRASTMADKLADAPPPLAAAAVADPRWPARALADEFGPWFDAAVAKDPAARSMWVVGAVDQATLDGLAARGEPLEGGAITIQAAQAYHLARPEKVARGQAVPAAMLRELPLMIAKPKAVLRDLRDGDLLYVYDGPAGGDGRLVKLVVRPNQSVGTRPPGGQRRRVTTNAIQSAGLVEARNLADPKAYEILSGRL